MLSDKTIPELENETLEFWKKNKIFEKSVNQRSENNLYVFYDGPPFISGLPHYGHLLGSIAKDVIPRYFAMKGKRVERVWGWDAHGLTVENRVQEKLGIKKRRDIENYGLEKFTEACYEYTAKTSAEWNWYIDKIGRWVDMEHAYRTTDMSYMESVMWAFKQLYDKELIYEGIRTSLFCTTCGTPVSNFEIAMDDSYKDVEDPAITVKFPIITESKFKGVSILAWTTTPWTIPSNRALVADEKEIYVVVECENEKYIVAEKRAEAVFEGKKYSVVEKFNGGELLGLEYEPPYRFFKSIEGEFKVYKYENMVNMEDGTGIVHSAPGFGDIDTEMGRHYNLTLMMTIDDEGKFLAGTDGKSPYEGMFYKDTDSSILEDLKKRNLLFKDEKIIHRFPYHDRCNTLLVQKAQNSWFIDVAKLKDQLIKNNENINWVPEYIKRGWFRKNIDQAPDWCISRTRFWATPMPVWESSDGDRIVVSSIKEIEELSGQKVKDLHRPYIDEIVLKKDGKEYRRRAEVLDSWMEASSMPYAAIHYPFENKEKFEKNYPGDYISEYTAQVRAWFYTMHILATALFGSNSFKNVIVTGVIAGTDGRKMSKTYQNYPDPRNVIETYGGDALRLYLMNSPLMLAENTNIDEEEIKNKLRKVINPLWNCTKFFLTYAKSPKKLEESDHVLDKWITIRLHETIKEFSTGVEKYMVPQAVRAIEEFVDDLSRWYVRRSRERITSGDNKAISTLYNVLVTFSKGSAPIIPFVAESIYRNLVVDGPESVHLCDYPEYSEKVIEEGREIIKNMKEDREVVSLFLAERTEKNIPIRQPLGSLSTISQVHYSDIVKSEVNVKEIISGAKENVLYTDVTEDLRLEGLYREMVRKIQDLRKKEGVSVSDLVDVVYENTEDNKKVMEKFGEELKKKVSARILTPGNALKITKSTS